MEDIFKNLWDIFKSAAELYTKPRELAAIHLTKPVITGEGKTVRIAPEATLCIKDGAIIDCSDENKPNYKVLMCYGTLVNQFELTLISLLDNSPLQIKI